MIVRCSIVEGALGPAAPAPPPGAGATLVFEGIVRPTEDGKPLAALHYDAYRPMADRELERLTRETAARHALLGLDAMHSVGLVGAGQVSFRLTVYAKHRAEALAAADDFIIRLKQDVPIWKSTCWE